MTDHEKIIEHLRKELEPKDYIYALWIEGSLPQGFADEYSDIDVWLSTDDDKVHTIFDEIKSILEKLGEIDYEHVSKPRGELGARTYHIKGMGEHLFIDFNTQGISRDVYLLSEIDTANVLFDKRGVVKFQKREKYQGDIEAKRDKLRNFYEQFSLRVVKCLHRNQPLEALYYWHLILQYATIFLRRKHGWHDKTEYDLKHIHRDLPTDVVEKLKDFYDTKTDDFENKLPELRKWIWEL